MRQTKKLTLSAMVVALGTLFLVLGAVVDVLDLSACALASVLVAFVFIEVGAPYHFLVWLATALASFIIYPGGTVWILYLSVFGIYPILKAYIERLPRIFWIILKLVYINIILVLLIFLIELIFDMPVIASDNLWIRIGMYVFFNAALLAYDFFMTVMIRFYFNKIRNKIIHLLK